MRLTSEFREISEVMGTFCNFSKRDWGDLNKRLTLFYLYCRKRDPRWGQFDSDDLIRDAIADLCVGKRHWPVDISISLVTCLQGVIRSKVNHTLVMKNKHQLIEETPETSFLKKENSSIRLQLRVELLDLVGDDDPDLSRLVGFYVQDMESKRRDMLPLMPDLSKTDIFNAWRRLNKLIARLEEEQEND
jgi:hypothetical protein